jgi:omega-6 fatty acid desaturase (delta-12 desaturase)
MTNDEYQLLIEEVKNLKSDNLVAWFFVLALFGSTTLFLFISSFGHGSTWLIAQIFLSINFLQWFFLLHDLAHDHYFENKKTNVVIGHLASIFSILPFYPWRYIHRSHHFWTGFKDKDPTQKILTRKDIPIKREKIINFCWKYWIPIFTLSFAFNNFWNIKKLNLLYPDKKNKNYFSILFPVLVHLYFLSSMGLEHYLKVWGLSYLLFLIYCDPLLLSQHSGIKQQIAGTDKIQKIHFKDQDIYTRGLNFPHFAERFIFFGFNRHVLHHHIPTLPGYHLTEINFKSERQLPWKEWLIKSKKISGVDLLFKEDQTYQ